MKSYSAVEFSTMIGVSSKTLYRWDKSGLLKANRTPSNRKYYTAEHFRLYRELGGRLPDGIETGSDTPGEISNADLSEQLLKVASSLSECGHKLLLAQEEIIKLAEQLCFSQSKCLSHDDVAPDETDSE